MANKEPAAFEISQWLRMLPMGQYEFVTVTFQAADTDTVITTALRPEDVNAIRWIDVSPSTGRVYRAADPNKRPWAAGYIILRSTVAGTTRLLLFVERS